MRWRMGNIKVEHEGFCKNLWILVGELLVSGVLVGPRLRGSFCPSTCHRPHCMETFQVGEFLFYALWDLQRGSSGIRIWGTFHCQGLILGPFLTPMGRGRSKHSPRAWGPAPVQAGPQKTQSLLRVTSQALKGSFEVCRPGIESWLCQLLLCVLGQVAKNLPQFFSYVKWDYYKQQNKK